MRVPRQKQRMILGGLMRAYLQKLVLRNMEDDLLKSGFTFEDLLYWNGQADNKIKECREE